MIKKLFTPNDFIDSLEDFDADKYLKLGFNVLLLDIDSTLVPNHTKHPDDRAINFIENLKEKGIRVIIYSNNTKERVDTFCEKLDVEHYCWSFKPLFYIYIRILIEKKLKRQQIMTLGDQLITDIFGSHKMGLYAIYIKPLKSKEAFYTSFNRILERLLFKYVIKK